MSTVSRVTQSLGYVQAACSSAAAGVLAVTLGSGSLSGTCFMLGVAIAVKTALGRVVQEPSRDTCPLSNMPHCVRGSLGAALSCAGLMAACLATLTASLGWAVLASLLVWGGGALHLQSLIKQDPQTYFAGALMNTAVSIGSWVLVYFMCSRASAVLGQSS